MRNCLLICCFTLSLLANAQTAKWVEVTGRYYGADVTPEEGRRKALEFARGEAIKMVVGVKTMEETYWNQSSTIEKGAFEDSIDVFSRLSRSTASGRITEEEKEETTILENGQPVYIVKLNARVVADEESPDPEFQVTLTIDRDVYYDRSPRLSDEVRLRISSSRDCYLYLFNIMANDSVQLLMPSGSLPMNQYTVDTKTQLFEQAVEARSIHFRVGVPPGRSRTKEALYLVATRGKIDFSLDRRSGEGRGGVTTRVAAFNEIMNWLLRIPSGMRTEAFKSYEIRRWEGQ